MDAVAAPRDDTFPKLLLRNAKIRGDRPAMRQKDLGIWQTWTWAEVLDEVRAFAVGFSALGISRGDKVAIVGQNRPRLYWAICAAQSLGAVPVPLYADSVADEMAYVLEHAEVVAAVVEDQEQVDKLLSIADAAAAPEDHRLRREAGPSGLRSDASPRLRRGAGGGTEASRGRRPKRKRAGSPRSRRRRGSDLAILLYTSGTTGRPKGVMLSFENLVVSAQNGNAFDRLGENEETIAYLPDGLGRRPHLLLRAVLRGRLLRELPGKPGDGDPGPARDRPHLFLRPAARLREPAHIDHGAHAGCRTAEARHVPFLHGRGEASGREDPRRRTRAPRRSPALCARSRARLWAGDEPARLHAAQGRLHRGRGDRPRNLPLLPLARDQPEAALRADRGERLHHHAAGRRDRRGDGRQARPGRGDPDRRERRGALSLARRVPRLPP